MSIGLTMRNRWGLWAGSELAQWFNALGIGHPDDMSGIILHSYWRRLNGYPIELSKQVSFYRSWWTCSGEAAAASACGKPKRPQDRPPNPKRGPCPTLAVARIDERATPESEPPPPPPLPPFMHEHSKRGWIAMSLIGAVQHARLDALNAEVTRNDYGSLATTHPHVGFAFDGGRGRTRWTWDIAGFGGRSHARASDGERFAIRNYDISLHAGYDLYQYQGFSVFPMIGTGLGGLTIDVEPTQSAVFAEALRSHPDVESVDYVSWMGAVNFGIEQILPVWRANGEDVGLLMGVRIGYYRQLVRGDWYTLPDGPSFGSAPDTDLSGLHVRFSVGLAASPLRW